MRRSVSVVRTHDGRVLVGLRDDDENRLLAFALLSADDARDLALKVWHAASGDGPALSAHELEAATSDES